MLQAGLAKDPALRPQTSAELIEQLRSTTTQPSPPIGADANAGQAAVAQVKHALGTSTVATPPPTAAPLRPATAAEASAPKPVVSAAAPAVADRRQAPARPQPPKRVLAGVGVGVSVLLAATVAVAQPFEKADQANLARGMSTASAELAASGLAAPVPSGPTTDSTGATADEESAAPLVSPESPFIEGPYESPPGDVDGSVETSDGDVGISSLAVMVDDRPVFGQTNGVVGVVRNPVDGVVEIERFEGHEAGSFIFAVSGLDDGRIASGGSDNTVQVWHPDDLESDPIVFTGHTDTVHDLAELADGRIVSASVDTTVQVWDPQNTSQVATFTGHSSGVLGLTVLPDGRVASSSWDNTVQVWDPDAPDADPIVYTGHSADVFAVAGLADGRIVSAGVDTTVQIWDPDNLGAEPIVLSRHQASVESLVVIDGWIVSGGDDEFVLIWDLEDLGAEPARLEGQTSGTPAIASYDDSLVIASRGDGTYSVWDPANPVS